MLLLYYDYHLITKFKMVSSGNWFVVVAHHFRLPVFVNPVNRV